MEEVVNIHSWKLSVWPSSLHGSHPLRTSLRLTRAEAGAWAAPPPSPRRSPSPPAPPCGPCVVWGGGEHSRTSSLHPISGLSHLRLLHPLLQLPVSRGSRIPPPPAPRRRPGAPLAAPRDTALGREQLPPREGKQSQRDKRQPQPAPGRRLLSWTDTRGWLWTPLELPPHRVPLEGSGAGRGEGKGFCCLRLPFASDL